MLIYNTTYHIEIDHAKHFYIWLHEVYIPEIEKLGQDSLLKNPRICRILSHQENDSECLSLQWEVATSADLHTWHTQQGMSLNEEMIRIFKDKVIGIPTLMEVLD